MVTCLIVVGRFSAPLLGVVVCIGADPSAGCIGVVVGGGGGGAPRWTVENGDCVPSVACSVSSVASMLSVLVQWVVLKLVVNFDQKSIFSVTRFKEIVNCER